MSYNGGNPTLESQRKGYLGVCQGCLKLIGFLVVCPEMPTKLRSTALLQPQGCLLLAVTLPSAANLGGKAKHLDLAQESTPKTFGYFGAGSTFFQARKPFYPWHSQPVASFWLAIPFLGKPLRMPIEHVDTPVSWGPFGANGPFLASLRMTSRAPRRLSWSLRF